jgi:hypothetical protein
MHGGLERMVSCAGREIFLKSAIQAIPTFSMCCFRLSRRKSVDSFDLIWLSIGGVAPLIGDPSNGFLGSLSSMLNARVA